MAGSILDKKRQITNFQKANGYNILRVTNENVHIVPTNNTNGCRMMKCKTIEHCFEDGYSSGSIFAIHPTCSYVAYGIKTGNAPEMIRIVNYSSMYSKAIKAMNGPVQDFAFGHKISPLFLAYIDINGCVFIFQLIENDNLRTHLDVQLYANMLRVADINQTRTLSWCPFFPNNDEDLDFLDLSNILVVTTGNVAELWKVDRVHKKYGTQRVRSGEITDDYVAVVNQASIRRICFSPDGTTMALVCDDGSIRFYQIDFCDATFVHEWIPLGGECVTMLYFLDDCQSQNSETEFWKFAVTGSARNTEIKVWSCETWKCLQTLSFQNDRVGELHPFLDLSGTYLFLQDTEKLFVLHFDKSGGSALVKYVVEFCFPFSIVKYGLISINNFNDDTDISFENEINMLLVVAKGIKMCTVKYSTEEFEPLHLNHSTPLNKKSTAIRDNVQQLSSAQCTKESAVNHLSTEISDANLENGEKGNVSSDSVASFSELQDMFVFGAVDKCPLSECPLDDDNYRDPVDDDTDNDDADSEDAGSEDTDNEDVDNEDNRQNAGYKKTLHKVDNLNSSFEEQQIMSKKLDAAFNEIENVKTVVAEQKATLTSLESSLGVIRDYIFKKCDEKRIVSNDLTKGLSETANDDVQILVADVIEEKFTPVIKQSIASEMDKVKQELMAELARGVGKLDRTVEDGIRSAVNDKVFSDAAGNSATTALMPVLTDSFRVKFENDIYPHFKNNCLSVADEVNSRLSDKINALMQGFEERARNVIHNTGDHIKTAESAIIQLVNTMADKANQMNNVANEIKPALMEAMKMASEEQKIMLQSYLSKLPENQKSQDSARLREHLLRLVSTGQISKAFQHVLAKCDDNSLIYLCEEVDVDLAFSDASSFHPNAIFCLIQSLTFNLSVKTELKLKYITRAVMCADSKGPITVAHSLNVLASAKKRLSDFIADKPPNYKHVSEIKLLIMALNSLGVPDEPVLAEVQIRSK